MTAVTPPWMPTDQAPEGFVVVPQHVLRCLNESRVDLFIAHDSTGQAVLFREAGYPLSRDRADHLKESCQETLFVRSNDFGEFCQQLFDSLDSVLQEGRLTEPQRFATLQSAVAMEVELALRLVNCHKYLSLSDRIGTMITSLLADSAILPIEIYRIASHDAYTFVHVTNVTSFSVLLAQQLGIFERGQLNALATGAMLHDVGKRFIPRSILTKPGPLTEKERRVIETHPQRGYEELYQHEELDFAQLMIVYQHHEHLNGNGYPVGVMGEEIHLWAKLVSVVDVFDAMTARRPYRPPISLNETIDFIQSRAGSQFDKEMVTCWVAAMRQK